MEEHRIREEAKISNKKFHINLVSVYLVCVQTLLSRYRSA